MPRKPAKKTAKRSTAAKQATRRSSANPTTRRSSAKPATKPRTTANPTTKPRATAEPPGIATTRKRSTGKASSAESPAGRTLAARVAAAVNAILARLRTAAPAALANLRPPATDLSRVEAALARPLPADLAAFWRLHDGGLPIFEYAGLSSTDALRRRAGLEKLRRNGTFADHEIFEQHAPRIRPVKWHTGWLPLAEDGCGNLYCIDLEPGPAGQVGQVIRWEVRGGPFAAGSATLADVLERYAAALPRFTYDIDSGIFDGPHVDLLADP